MTPIASARNLGPKTAIELAAVGIETLEVLRELGFEEALDRVVQTFPERININMAYALLGAIEDVDWRALSPSSKAQATSAIKRLKAERS